MPTLRLTKAAIDSAKSEGRDTFLWDATLRGLGVKITPSGSKVFIYQYRMGGRGSKLRRFTIGRYGELTLEAARRKAEELARQVRLDGNDPLEAKRSARAKAAELAFAAYAERFWRECLQIEWKSSHAQSYRALELQTSQRQTTIGHGLPAAIGSPSALPGSKRNMAKQLPAASCAMRNGTTTSGATIWSV